jgi:elongation factor Ts
MAKITLDLIQKLRERSGVGMLDCRKALEEATGDIEVAVSLLRKKGLAIAAKRADNLTANGTVDAFLGVNSAALAEISCETDFSARTDIMREFVKKIAETAALDVNSAELPGFLDAKVASKNLSVQMFLNELISKICENIKIASIKAFKLGDNAVAAIYVHPDHSVACMVELVADRSLSHDEKAEIREIAREICMQVAVNKPLAIRPNDLERRLVENEKEIARTQLAQTTKPESMWDMIIEGKLKKFYEDVCLLNQKFIKDDSVTIGQKIEALAKRLLIGKLTLTRFERIGINR